jgi:hypothetical protein
LLDRAQEQQQQSSPKESAAPAADSDAFEDDHPF